MFRPLLASVFEHRTQSFQITVDVTEDGEHLFTRRLKAVASRRQAQRQTGPFRTYHSSRSCQERRDEG